MVVNETSVIEASKLIGQAMAQGDKDKAEALKAEVADLKQTLPALEEEERTASARLNDMLAGLPGPHWLVLGDMGEVGTQGPAFHAEVGHYARERGIEHVWTAGELCAHAAQAYGPSARHFPTGADIVAALPTPDQAPVVGSVLVKGSRFMKMEQVVSALTGAAHAA